MTIQSKWKTLSDHGILFTVKDDRTLADSMEAGTKPMEKTVDVTDWTRKQLLSWLGY